jgi:kynurenine 3-monooxygenase
MLIALPNQDKTFTLTLFMPNEMFEQLKSKEDVVDFFRKNFNDALNLMGEKHLLDVYFSSKPSPLVSVKVNIHLKIYQFEFILARNNKLM